MDKSQRSEAEAFKLYWKGTSQKDAEPAGVGFFLRSSGHFLLKVDLFTTAKEPWYLLPVSSSQGETRYQHEIRKKNGGGFVRAYTIGSGELLQDRPGELEILVPPFDRPLILQLKMENQ